MGKGAKHDIKKTFKNLPAGTYQISLDFIKIDSWDNEKAIVQVNGKQCWTKTFTGVQGKQICGSKSNNWNELKVKATCKAAAVKGAFTVRVTTTLNSGAGDESFAIDNAVLTKVVAPKFKTIKANFANVKDQQGWNCGKVQKCGSIGNVCGGYGTKGAKHDIKKTFKNLPAGTYQISLDFIKIDSWDNEKAIVQVNGKQCWMKTFTNVQGKQICGSKNGNWNELKVKATCTAAAVKGVFTVRVTSTLNSGAGDESFGIDNVVLTKVAAPAACQAPKYLNKDKKCVACPKGSTCDGKKATACKAPKVVKANKCVAAPFKTIKANFANDKDQQGWNCGKIQKCGNLGNICGGYNTKGAK